MHSTCNRGKFAKNFSQEFLRNCHNFPIFFQILEFKKSGENNILKSFENKPLENAESYINTLFTHKSSPWPLMSFSYSL